MSRPTNTPDAQAIRSLRLQLGTAKQHLKDGLNIVSKALQALESWEDEGAIRTTDHETADQTVAIMRARGGRGLPSKIDRDPELRNFIRSHIYRLPYAAIVRMVAERLPKHRHTSTSAMSRWWQKERPQSTASDAP